MEVLEEFHAAVPFSLLVAEDQNKLLLIEVLQVCHWRWVQALVVLRSLLQKNSSKYVLQILLIPDLYLPFGEGMLWRKEIPMNWDEVKFYFICVCDWLHFCSQITAFLAVWGLFSYVPSNPYLVCSESWIWVVCNRITLEGSKLLIDGVEWRSVLAQ